MKKIKEISRILDFGEIWINKLKGGNGKRKKK